MKSRIVLSVGSNSGDRNKNVSTALRRLSEILGGDASVSDIYETPDAHGGVCRYMNAVMAGYTELTIEECDRFCKLIETEAGRDNECRKRGEVPVDVDIVVWDGKVVRERDYRQNFFTIGFGQIQD